MNRKQAVKQIERAMVRIRRSQTRRVIGSLMERETRRRIKVSHIFVVDAIEEAITEGSQELTVGAVAEHLGVDPSRASRMVASAVKAGYVSRAASQGDGRRSLLNLTGKGLECAREARNFRIAFFGRLMDNWPDRDCQEFARLLARFTETPSEPTTPRTPPTKRA